MKREKAAFAMGCFWEPEYIFAKTKGITETKVGYMGGKPDYKNPTYRQV